MPVKRWLPERFARQTRIMMAFGGATSKAEGLFGGINVGCTSGTPILALIPRTNLSAPRDDGDSMHVYGTIDEAV